MSIRSRARLGFVAAVIGTCLILAVPAFGVNRDGVWQGSTSQDRPIRFEVEGDTITAVKISAFHEACTLVVLARLRDTSFAIEDEGSFRMRFFGGDNAQDRLIVRGEFTSRLRARGTFRSIQDNRDCRDTVSGTWRVEKAAGPRSLESRQQPESTQSGPAPSGTPSRCATRLSRLR